MLTGTQVAATSAHSQNLVVIGASVTRYWSNISSGTRYFEKLLCGHHAHTHRAELVWGLADRVRVDGVCGWAPRAPRVHLARHIVVTRSCVVRV